MKKLIALLTPFLTATFVSRAPAKRTVNGALVHLNKAVEELKAVRAFNDKEIDRQEQIAAQAQAAAAEASAEAQRAARVTAKLEALLG